LTGGKMIGGKMLTRCGGEGRGCGRAETLPVRSSAKTGFFPDSVSGHSKTGSNAVMWGPGMKIRRLAMMVLALSIAFLFRPAQALASTTYDQCIYALDQTAANALYLDGAIIINAPTCGVVVDSSSSTALKFSGSGSFTAKYFDVVGKYSTSGSVTFSPTPTTGSAYQGDPLTFLVPPSSSTCNYTNFKVTTGSSTLNPGTYCNGITISGATIVTFNPGTYILMGGGLNVSGSSVIKGSGVTFFVTQGLGYSYGPISISSSVVATLSAPTTGSYYGILVYQDRGIGTGKAANTVTGASSSSLEGVLYFPTTALTLSGAEAGGNCLIVIADTITLTGAAALGNGCSGGSPLQPPVAVSVSPATATLYGGQTQQFTATVINTSNTAVTWTISPAGTGTISSSGLYTAPATISTQQTVTVTATSQANTAASASSTVTLMPKTTPTITWAAPAAITYGTALSATQLDATASVAGTFVYTPAAGTVEAAGSQTLSVTFTPTNTAEYNTATATVALTVNKAAPTITWVTPTAITYGTALSATQLDATASVAGTFVYTPAAGTVEAAGTQTLSVTFTPTNTTDYNTATATVTLTVNDATPVITWAAPAAITYGTALSATQLDATASVAGTFVYTPAAGTVPAAGSQTLSVTFTPTNTTDYSTATATVTLTVNKATPTITWSAPAAITYGTALSATQLDATASVAGTFVYTPAAGTVEAAGTQTLSVTFTPTNTTDYNTATATVTLTVNDATPVITWAAPAAITYGTALSATQLDATASVAGTFVYTPAAGTVEAAGSQTLSVTFTPTNTTDYTTATATVALAVSKAAPVITWAAPAAIIYGTALSATQLDATASVAGTFVYTPAAGTLLATGTQTLSVTFTPTNTTDYTTATTTVSLIVQPLVAPTIVATALPAPNAADWNNSNVTVTFTCTAGSYPIKTCPAPIVVSAQAANQVISGTATDTNGNTASASVTVNLDTTPPTITASASPAPNAAGWNTTSVTVTFTCADTLSGVATCPASQLVSTAGANQVIKGTATDVAGNTASAQITLNISKTPPTITPLVAPSPNSAGWNNSPVTVSFTCTPGGAPITSCPSPTVVTTQGSNIPVTGTVTDASGATATATVVIKLDSTPPTIIPSISPAPNSNGWETSPVTVSFTCSDSLSGIATCPSSTLISTDGANQTVSGTATDVAGNTATATANVNLEQSGPTISASVSPAANSYGWNNTSVTVTFNCTKGVSTITSCSSPQTVSSQGVGQVISGTVQDQAGNQATTSVTLNIDETPPAIVQFTAPTQLSPGQSGSASLTVSDIAPIASVAYQLNGTAIGSSMTPPYSVSVTAPSTITSGSTLTLTVVVTDVAGNTASSSKGIQVAASGVVVGEVLSDATGLPLPGATVQVIGQSSQNSTSDSQGQYSIPVTSSQLFLSISQPGNSGNGTPTMVTVQRQVAVQSGVGTVPVDARMTALAAPTTITASGGTVGTGAITLTVPPGGATTSYTLTPLSQQGLPGLLPLGWSPVAAFDLQTNVSTSASLSANFTGLPTGTLHLVSYSYNVYAWSMVTPNLTASSGSLTVPLPSTGDYALVVTDAGNASIQIPAAGQPLTGVAMVTLPTSATSTGSLSPGNIAPTGGTSIASLAVQSSTPLPSGTVIQSQVIETYTLTSGQLISDEPRYEDILLYQSPAAPSGSAVGASFPVTPSQTFQVSQLTSGDVHLNILSGRESVRGQTGGSDPVAVQSGDATLTIAAGSLPQDTAIAVTPESVDTFLPSTTTLVPLSEYNVNLSDQVLSNAAQLSVGTAGATPGANVVVVEEQRVGGVPYLVVVAMAQVTATNIVSLNTPGLPGITQGGDYVFYELNVPTGFVSGTVSTGSGPVAAMVQTDGLPFVVFSNSNGNYMVAAAAGTVNLTASIANTALAGTASVQVTAGQTATANITVAGQVEAATITPANGALGVPLTAEIDVTATDGFNQSTVTSSSVVLTAAGSSTPVALRFVFSGGGNTLAVFPQSALQPSTQYTFQASGLANALGGLISVPTISFTTVAITPPTYNTNALVFAMPDSNGNVAISAPAGSFPAGSTILIVDQTNGVVYSLTVFNDGSVTGSMPATINDVMQVTLTDPSGNVTNFTVGQFSAADGSVAVNAGGGTVTGPGGVSMIIPPGALNQGAVFQIQSLDATAFPTLPSWGTAAFGSGIQINAPSMPTFNKEVKLAFPVPANAPPGAFYYVFRQDTDQNNNTYFETIDQAFVQGTGASAQVVTASPPFCGYTNSTANFQASATASFSPLGTAITKTYMMWDYDPNQPGTASTGLIVGNILQTVQSNGLTTYVPYTGSAKIQLANSSSIALWTPPPACAGTFTIFDFQLGGGQRTVTAQIGTQSFQETAYEVNGIQTNDADYDVTAGLEFQYQNIGRVTFTVPPPPSPTTPPQINIGIFNANTVAAINGIVPTGTPLTILLSSNLTLQSVSINGSECDGIACPTLMGAAPPANPGAGMNYYQLNGPYTPGTPGPYSITATGVNPLNLTGSAVSVTQGFLAVQAGGTNDTLTTSAPIIINSTPANNAQNVSPIVFPTITFSEPVTNVANNVSLVGSNGDAPTLNLIGITTTGTVTNPVQPMDSITSLTIQPTSGLEFNDTYTLLLSPGIMDADGRPLAAPTSVVFSTYAPFQLGSATSPLSVLTRPVVIGNYAYVGALAGGSSVLSGPDVINVTDPAYPMDLGLAASFVGRVTDAAGQANSPVPGGSAGLIALSASFAEDDYIPSNIWLYGVNPLNGALLNRVGAVSATSSATQSGVALRLSMLDQYLYASTFLQGLQVIDLNQAVTEYQSVYTSNPSQFGEAVSTEGDGFAMDTIVNTIPLPINTQGGTATEFDLKAAYFASMTGGVAATQPLIVATGALPLVVADPSAGSNGVLYPPYTSTSPGAPLTQAPLQMTSGTTVYSLTNGVALDVGIIPVTVSGATTNKQYAVVVGSGTVNGTGASLLAVVDISQPYVPASQGPYTPGTPYLPLPVSFFQLSTGPTDVILDGTMALVGTGSNVLIVDLTNPAQPVNGGVIAGSFGSRLALDSNGVLIAAGNIPSSSVQTAATIPTVQAQPQNPIFAAITQGDSYGPTNQQQFQLLSNLPLAVLLVPPNPAITTGTLTLTNTATGANITSYMLTFNQAGQAQVTLPAGMALPPSFTAKPTVSQNGILSVPAVYTVGTAAMLLDLNNDTRLNSQTDRPKLNPALPAGVKFGFWQADPTVAKTQEGLTDFAQIQLKIDALPTAAQGKLYLQLQGNAGTPSWVLTSNVGVPANSPTTTLSSGQKLYLSDTTPNGIPSQQLQLTSEPPVDCSSAGGTNSPANTLCQSDGTGSIELTNLGPGIYTLLFSCTNCPTDPTRVFQLAVVGGSASAQTFPSAGTAPPGLVEQQFVDIRPIQNWVSVFSARETDPPPAEATAPAISGWNNAVPQGGSVTVLVHGYDVSENDALTAASTSGQSPFVPALTKRMYWAAFPMLPVQTVPTSAGNVPAYTVGFLWEGDYSITLPELGITSILFDEYLSPKFAPLYFPDDTFRAFESGTALANLLAQLSNNNSQVNVIAHSLGNMVVNAALTQLPQGTVENYVMNEAAIPADAFFTDYDTLNNANAGALAATNPYMFGFLTAANPTDGIPFQQDYQTKHLAQLGQTDNTVWTQLLSQVLASPTTMINGAGAEVTNPNSPLVIYEQFYGDDNPTPTDAAAVDYTSRWQFLQGQNYGPWLGYFASNLQNTNLFNSYSNADCVINNALLIKQLVQSPDRSFGSVPQASFGDSIGDLNYAFTLSNYASPFPTANLTDNLQNQQWLFQPSSSPALYGNTANYRRWTRMAYWYPGTAIGTGAYDFSDAFGDENKIPLTQYGGYFAGLTDISGNPTPASTCYSMPNYVQDGLTNFTLGGAGVPGFNSTLANALQSHPETHGYLRAIPLPSIWLGYKAIRMAFYPSIPDPDKGQ
jgi:hypothetical protein